MSSITFLKPAELPQTVEIISPYAYGELDSSVAQEAKGAAQRINKHLAGVTASFIDIGLELTAIKGKLPHGQFSKWIAAEFGMSQRTAQNYMNAAAFTANFDAAVVERIPQKIIYELAAPNIPSEIAIDVYETVEKGQPLDVPAILDKISSVKADTQKQKLAAKVKKLQALKLKGKSPEQIAKLQKRQALAEKKQAAIDEKNAAEIVAKKQAAADCVAMMKEHLGDDYPKFIQLYQKSAGWIFDKAMLAEIAAHA